MCRVSSAAAKEGKSLFVIMGIGHSYGDRETGTSVTARAYRAWLQLRCPAWLLTILTSRFLGHHSCVQSQ